MCEVAGFSRSGYYRFLDPVKPARLDMDLMDEIQKIAVEWPCYGSRRITEELKVRKWEVNRKRVQRLMREDNLLCVTKRRFLVPTTDSAHGLRVYPNRAASMILTGLDQLWVADITYIRLEEEFIYLAVILDAYSRRVIGWHLDQGLYDSLTLSMHYAWRYGSEPSCWGWSIISIVACSMPATSTRNCSKTTGLKSA